MKTIYSLLIILTFGLSTIAQDKVVERSGKRPKWINNIENNHIITGGSGKTVALAQEEAINMVKEQIVRSIADKIIAKSEIIKTERTIDNNQSTLVENFKSKIISESGKIDFLNGININKAIDFYWEKLKDKKTKTYSFNYYIKYPFTQTELNSLIDNYKKKDKELTLELERCLEKTDNITSTEQIATTIIELKQLREKFIDKRQDKADLAIEKLNNMYRSADIQVLENRAGSISFSLSINNKSISSIIKPRIRSNCIKIVDLKKAGEKWILKYTSEDCYEDEENFVLLYMRLPNKSIKKKIYIDITQGKAEISLVSNIVIQKDTIAKENQCNLTLRSKYSSPLIIESINLEFKSGKPIILDKLDKILKGEGIHNISFTLPLDTSIEGDSDFVNGYISYKALDSDKKQTYKIYKHRYNLCF